MASLAFVSLLLVAIVVSTASAQGKKQYEDFYVFLFKWLTSNDCGKHDDDDDESSLVSLFRWFTQLLSKNSKH